ncbi:diphthine--ammonia ligase [Mesobacillus jeotgali]|uniref:Dph6-related ATP pyrophosphatase n=1 Tax=Mesobacillus jeotgali TaxID=129985 RepID=UPI0009A8F84A|nr:diphthine--ammonia ligase [Mesobacillus jeotgali]
MKIVMGFSGGKDSTLALYKIQNNPDYEVDSLLVTLTEGTGRVSIHGVRHELLKQQSESLGIRLREVWIPQECSNDKYQEIMRKTFSELKADGVTHIAFGDIHLQDIREYRENLVEGTGLTAIFPLWNHSVDDISNQFIQLGFESVITCIDLEALNKCFLGRIYDRELLKDYPKNHDICGEKGEFHSLVFDGPNFKFPLSFEKGAEKVTPDYFTGKDRFLFIDLIPIERTDHKQ